MTVTLRDPPGAAGVDITAAIALGAGRVTTHAGLYYTTPDGQTRFQHLAGHLRFEDEPADGSAGRGMGWVVPSVHPTLLGVVAEVCALVAARSPRPAYGFRFVASHFNDSGDLVVGPDDSGLTCATFVLAVFERSQVPLLVRSSWAKVSQDRLEEDRRAHLTLISALEMASRPEPRQQAIRLRAELDAPRFRAEEVAAASAMTPRPVSFDAAAADGARLLEEGRSREWW